MQWSLSRVKGLIPTIQEFIFLYIRKLFECLYDHLSDLQIEKMMKQSTQITVSDLCQTIVIWHKNDRNVTVMFQMLLTLLQAGHTDPTLREFLLLEKQW